MVRPKRLYKTEKDGDTRYYYLIKGKKRYIKVPEGISQKQVVKINIKNVAPEGRRIKRRKKRLKVKYEKPIVDGMKKAEIKPQLPVYFFQPQKQITAIPDQTKPLKIEELKGDDLKGITKLLENSQKDNEFFKKVLIKNMELMSKPPQLPPPEIQKTLPEIKSRTEAILERAKEIRDRTPISTPIPTPEATPLREEEEEEEVKPIKKYVGIPENIPNVYLPTQLRRLLKRELTDDEKSSIKNSDTTRMAIVRELKSKITDFPDIPSSNFNEWKKEIKTQYDISLRFGGEGSASLSEGLYNDEIGNVLKKRIKDFVPVIPVDKVKDMVKFVKPHMKRFGFIVNTNPSTSDGSGNDGYREGHWRSVYFNNEDDFKSAEYFDPLAEGNPEPELLEGMKMIARKMNPENYFLFKVNNLKRQPDGTATCGWHSIKFLDDRFQGIGWDEATGYNDYMEKHKPDGSKDGEMDIKNYFEKYKSYI